MRKQFGSRLLGHAHLAWVLFGLLVLALLLLPELTKAEAASDPPQAQSGAALKVYVSLPRQGANAGTSKLIVKGLNAAVRSVNGKVGGKRIRLVQLDDARGSRWKAGLVRRNARQAVADPAAVAYVGELNSEATAVAKPILARAGMPIFAPIATADSLTPELESLITAKRPPNLFRTIPSDGAQAAALVTYLKRSGIRRAVLIDDGALYGKGLADGVARESRERKVRILGRFHAHPNGKGRRTLIRRIAMRSPQAVVFTGSLSSDAVPLFKALNRAMPKTLLFGGDALAHDSFARRVGPARSMVRLTRPAAHTNPKNRRLRKLLGRRPDSVTVFAYDGMTALLRAIQSTKAWQLPTTGQRRAAIRDDLFSGRFQKGAVSTWVVLPNGDSSNGVFDAIRLGKNRVIEPIEIVARRQRIRDRGARGQLRANSSSLWAEIGGNPNLTTSQDLEALISSYSDQTKSFLWTVLEQTRVQAERVRSEWVQLLSIRSQLSWITGFIRSRPEHFRLSELGYAQFSTVSAQIEMIVREPRFSVIEHLFRSDTGKMLEPGEWTKGAIDQALVLMDERASNDSKLLQRLTLIEQSVDNRISQLEWLRIAKLRGQ